MKKIRIIFVDHAPFLGGAQLRLLSHIKQLDKNKFDPILITSNNPQFLKRAKELDIKTIIISFGVLKRFNPIVLWNGILAFFNFRKELLKLKPDIVLANTTRAFIITAFLKFSYKEILYIRDYDFPKWLFLILDPFVDKYLLVSKSIRDFYELEQKKSSVVYLGSEIEEVLENVKEREVKSLRKKLGFKDSDFVVGFVGRLVDWKGADTLVDALSLIKDENIKVVLFGEGKGQPGDITGNLKFKISNLKLKNRVIVVGFIEDIGLIYKSIDCFVLTSKKAEPFATTVIEAALAKVPIIATNIGGTPEFVKNRKTGLLISPDNPSELAKALIDLKRSERLQRTLVKNAYNSAQAFTEEALAKKLERIYQRIG